MERSAFKQMRKVLCNNKLSGCRDAYYPYYYMTPKHGRLRKQRRNAKHASKCNATGECGNPWSQDITNKKVLIMYKDTEILIAMNHRKLSYFGYTIYSEMKIRTRVADYNREDQGYKNNTVVWSCTSSTVTYEVKCVCTPRHHWVFDILSGDAEPCPRPNSTCSTRKMSCRGFFPIP